MNHPSGYASFLFSSGYFHIFSDATADFSVLSRILFCIFPSVCKKICCFFFIRIVRFLRPFSLRRNNFPCLFYVGLRKFSVCFHNFFAFLELFQKKNPLFSLSITQFQTFFPCHRDNFHVFSRAGKEIFLPVFIIFVLFPGLFKGKILIFRNEFSVRTNIFSFSRGVFSDFFRVIR